LTLDVENIVRHWLHRQTLAGAVSPECRLPGSVKYDSRFRRMWEYYLSCGIAAAAVSDAAVCGNVFTNDSSINMPLARV
jgi:cyclopropane-fatty-acyl-phospholipid synthase